MKCPACNFGAGQPFEVCPKCGVVVKKFVQKQAELSQVRQAQQQTKAVLNSFAGEIDIEVTDKYTALTIVSLALKILAVLSAGIGALGIFQSNVPMGVKIGALAFSVLIAILVWAYSEILEIGVDIESNQRKLIKILMSK